MAKPSSSDTKGSQLDVYPNPSFDMVNFNIHMQGYDKATLIINDLYGKEIKRFNLTQTQQVSMNVDTLCFGYLLLCFAIRQSALTSRTVSGNTALICRFRFH